MLLLATTSVEADLGWKQVVEMICNSGYYPVIVTCTSLPSSILTEELNRIESEGFKPVILRMTDGPRSDMCSELECEKHGIIFPKELLPIIACQVAPAEQLLDFEVSITCQCSISGLIPDLSKRKITSNGSIVVSLSSRVQWTVIEGQKLMGFDDCLIKPSEICQEPEVVTDGLQAIVPAQHTVEADNASEIKQGFNMKDKRPSLSPKYQETTKKGPDQFVDKQVATSEANIQGETNLALVQRPESVDNIENHAEHGASVDPLKENKLCRFSKGVNSLNNRICSSLSLLFLWLGEILCILGQKVDIRTGVLIFAILGIGFPGSFQTSKNSPITSFEPKSINTQHFSLGTLRMANGPKLDICSKSELEKDGIMLPKNLSSSIPQQAVPAERFSWQHRKLNFKNPGTCPRAHHSTTHTGHLNNTYDMKQYDNHLKDEVPSSSQQKTKKDKSELFVDKQANNSSQANFQGEVNGGLIQRSNNGVSHWCSKIKAYVSNAASGDKLEENLLQGVMNYVYLLKDNFWSLLSLLLPLMDVIFGFMGRKPGIIIGVTVSIVLGVAIPMFVLTSENCLSPNPFQYDFATLMYAIAHSLMYLSLVLQHTQRQWLSYRMAGAAYSCVILSILGHNFSRVPLRHACSGVGVLLVFVLFAVFCGNTPDRTD